MPHRLFRKDILILAAILAVALAVRVWAVNFGLPNTRCRPDEALVIGTTVKFGTGDLNPHVFWYPSLYLYLLFAFYMVYFILGLITGKYASRSDFITEYAVNPSNLFLIDRLISVLLGAATVFVIFKIADRLFGRRVAVISSLFLALAYLHVRDSHFGTVDVAMTFMITCSVLFLIRCYETKTLRSYLVAGICAGLATSIKYNALLLIIPFAVVHLLNISEEKRHWTRLVFDRRSLLFGIGLLAAFTIGTPFAVLDFGNFISAVWGTVAYLNRGHGIILGRGWWYHLKFSLWIGLGWSLLLASILGMGVAARANVKKALLLCSFPIAYYLVVGKGYTVFLRYVLPLVPFLCVSAAVFIDYLASLMARFTKSSFQPRIAYVLAALAILPSALNVARFDALLAREDNRLIATRWVYENVPAGASIFQTGAGEQGELQLHSTLESLQSGFHKEGLGIAHRARLEFMKKGLVPGYNLWRYDDRSRTFTGFGRSATALPDYIILATSPIELYSRLEPEIEVLVDSCYQLEKAFEAGDFTDKRNVYDPLDAFFVPCAGFHKVSRPGPNIYVYKRLADKDFFQMPAEAAPSKVLSKKALP